MNQEWCLKFFKPFCCLLLLSGSSPPPIIEMKLKELLQKLQKWMMEGE